MYYTKTPQGNYSDGPYSYICYIGVAFYLFYASYCSAVILRKLIKRNDLRSVLR